MGLCSRRPRAEIWRLQAALPRLWPRTANYMFIRIPALLKFLLFTALVVGGFDATAADAPRKRTINDVDGEHESPPNKKARQPELLSQICPRRTVQSLAELDAQEMKANKGTTVVSFDFDETLAKSWYELFRYSPEDQLSFIREELEGKLLPGKLTSFGNL